MTDLEDELRRLLATRAGEVEPQLTAAGIRAAAARSRGQRLRTVGLPTAGAVLAAALLVTPFVLIHHGDSAPHRPSVIVPAGPSTPGSSPVGTRSAPTVAPSTAPSHSAVPMPSAPSTWPTPAHPVLSPSGSVPLPQTTGNGGTAPASMGSPPSTPVPTPTSSH